MEPETPIKDRLKKKLNKKKNEQTDENNLFDMLNQVSQVLKNNPEMVSKVNKCVSNIIQNKDLMDKLSSEIKDNISEEEITDGSLISTDE
jgi:hypothetical protein